MVPLFRWLCACIRLQPVGKDDVVYREIVILEMNCVRMLRTINELREGLKNDERFSRLRPVREHAQADFVRESQLKGPQAPSDPFEVPLESSHARG